MIERPIPPKMRVEIKGAKFFKLTATPIKPKRRVVLLKGRALAVEY